MRIQLFYLTSHMRVTLFIPVVCVHSNSRPFRDLTYVSYFYTKLFGFINIICYSTRLFKSVTFLYMFKNIYIPYFYPDATLATGGAIQRVLLHRGQLTPRVDIEFFTDS